MADEQRFENSDPAEDAILDELIQQSEAKMGSEFVRPSDDNLLAYVAGTATASELQRMQRALASSSSYRKEVLEFLQEIEELDRPELRRKFALLHPQVPETLWQNFSRQFGSRMTERASPLEWLRNLLRTPAFAYSIAVLALSIAGVQWFSHRGTSMPTETMLRSHSLHLIARSDLAVRQDRAQPLPVLTSTSQDAVVTLTLWLPGSMRPNPNASYDVRLSDDTGAGWTSTDHSGASVVDEQVALTLAIDGRRLHPGTWTVRIDQRTATATLQSVWAAFRVESTAN